MRAFLAALLITVCVPFAGLAAQPRFMGEVDEASNQFGENLVRGAATQIRAILAR